MNKNILFQSIHISIIVIVIVILILCLWYRNFLWFFFSSSDSFWGNRTKMCGFDCLHFWHTIQCSTSNGMLLISRKFETDILDVVWQNEREIKDRMYMLFLIEFLFSQDKTPTLLFHTMIFRKSDTTASMHCIFNSNPISIYFLKFNSNRILKIIRPKNRFARENLTN